MSRGCDGGLAGGYYDASYPQRYTMDGEQIVTEALTLCDRLPTAWYGSIGLRALSAASPRLISVAQRS